MTYDRESESVPPFIDTEVTELDVSPEFAEKAYKDIKKLAEALGLWPLIMSETLTIFGEIEPDNLNLFRRYQLAQCWEGVINEICRRITTKPWERNS